jgi:tetratricopeptide (TPR) repeat protein
MLSQAELAARSGLSTRAIRYLERGRVGRPRAASVRLLARALRLSGPALEEFELAASLALQPRATTSSATGVESTTPAEYQTTDPPGRTLTSYSSVSPALLPLSVPAFVGRHAEIANLDLLLATEDDPAPVVVSVVSGPAGVGKTALAVHWAHRVRGSFPDGQLYINLRGFAATGSPVQPGEAIRTFLDALAVPSRQMPVGLTNQVGLYRSLIADRRILIVLDNARDAEQVRPLLPGGDAARVVITSRNPLLGLVVAEGARPLPLDTVSATEATELLRRRLGTERVDREPEAAAEIIARCGGLPLALALVAARIAAYPQSSLQGFIQELRTNATPLDLMTTGQDPATDLRHVFSWSYATLSEPGKVLFLLLGLHPGPHVSQASAASLSGWNQEGTKRTLAELHDAGLLTETARGIYTLHDLLHAYAQELAAREQSMADNEAAVHRLLDHYLFSAVNADKQLEPHRDPIDIPAAHEGTVPQAGHTRAAALQWFAQEYPVLLRVVEMAAAQGFDQHAWRLPWALVTYLDLQSHRDAFKATQSIAVAAAQRLGNAEAEGRALRHLANATIQMGDLDEADGYLQRALTVFERLDDAAAKANTHMNLSFLCERQGRIEESNDHAAEALRLYRATGHRVGEGSALNALGYGHALLGDFQRALDCCQQALELDRANGNRKSEAHTSDSLGFIYTRLGDRPRAAQYFGQALSLFRESRDRYNEADALLKLGDISAEAGDDTAARRCWGEAAEILEELGHPRESEARQRPLNFRKSV